LRWGKIRRPLKKKKLLKTWKGKFDENIHKKKIVVGNAGKGKRLGNYAAVETSLAAKWGKK